MQPLFAGFGNTGAARFLQFPETPAERKLLLIRQPLVAEHQHGMAADRSLDCRDIIRRQRVCGVNAGHLGNE
ncbi:MAG TPA: hypothetical protein VME47_07995 [Acetobacteraceae bacterium]|nr:hypothetical protein [Acetobacteraceae bacterium]